MGCYLKSSSIGVEIAGSGLLDSLLQEGQKMRHGEITGFDECLSLKQKRADQMQKNDQHGDHWAMLYSHLAGNKKEGRMALAKKEGAGEC